MMMQTTESLIETIYVYPARARRLGVIPSRGSRSVSETEQLLAELQH